MFKRISLAGSEELFKTTQREADELPAAVEQAGAGKADLTSLPNIPTQAPERVYFQYGLTYDQVQTLIDAVQKLKYPHLIKQTTKLSIDEFERLDSLRLVLLEGLE